QRALSLAVDGTLGDLTRVEARMGMPAPQSDDPRWSLDLAGGALMDLGCYGLHIMRRFGNPTVVSATATQRTPGVDESCDV
ncbi:gfo/Idh/MocA family oxidoreductase, partial [Mycobacterium sp. ITM-2017-0098]